MWYVIPFVILLLIAILLKKRESQQDVKKKKPEKSKKNTSKRTQSNSSQRTPRPLSALAQSYAVQETPKSNVEPLSDELKANIETLIQSENYMTAEARINQALNQNSRQHELYSYLIDIHILQNDEFAIKQLSTYLHSIGLHYLADEAEDKLLIAQTAEQQLKDAEEFTSTHFITEIPDANDSDEFDHLVHAQKQAIQAQENQKHSEKEHEEEQLEVKENFPSQSSTFVFETEQYPHPLQVKEKVKNIDEEYVSAEPTAHFMFSSEFDELSEQAQQNKNSESDQQSFNLSEDTQSTATQQANKDEHFELDFLIEEPQPSTPVNHPDQQDEFKIELQPLDFDTDSIAIDSTPTQVNLKSNEQNEEQAPLEFDFEIADFKTEKNTTIILDQSTTQVVKSTIETSTVEQDPHRVLEFSFEPQEALELQKTPSSITDTELDNNLEFINEESHEIKPIDFSFDDALLESSQHLKTKTASSEDSNTLEFDLSEDLVFESELESQTLSTKSSIEAEHIETHHSSDLSFNSDFEIDQLPLEKIELADLDSTIQNESTQSQTVSLEDTKPELSALDYENDPIVLNFPEVLTIDEVQLNLELAEQYINFGAFEEAKKLLSEFQEQYTNEQRQTVTKLLQKIDS